MPMPPSLRWTLGHSATAAMPRRQVAAPRRRGCRKDGPDSSRPDGSGRLARSGTALAKAASSGSCGKQSPVSRDKPDPRQHVTAGAEIGRGEDPLLFAVAHLGMWIPRHCVPAASLRNRLGLAACSAANTGSTRSAQVQVGVADDGGCRSAGAIQAAGASGGQPLDKLDLPHGP